MKYEFRASHTFWRAYSKLTPFQQVRAQEVFEMFKMDPFHPGLKTHTIQKLSARFGKTIYSVRIEGDLRAVFYLEGNTVCSVDIGTHKIYR